MKVEHCDLCDAELDIFVNVEYKIKIQSVHKNCGPDCVKVKYKLKHVCTDCVNAIIELSKKRRKIK